MQLLTKFVDILTQEYIIVNSFKKEPIKLIVHKSLLSWKECNTLLAQLNNF